MYTTPYPKTCGLCGCKLLYSDKNRKALKLGLETCADPHHPRATSKAHYGHRGGRRRSREKFMNLPKNYWAKMGVDDPDGSRIFCYDCHEMVLHNPIFSEAQLDRLARLFKGKSFEKRVSILNRIFEKGLDVWFKLINIEAI